MHWLQAGYVHPARAAVDAGHHVRPIRGTDVDLDMAAVMGSQERLWSIFGVAWGWPPAAMTRDEDLADLLRHEREIEAHESFNYALFDDREQQLLGCVYIDPPEKAAADAEVSWWVVDDLVGTALEADLDAFVPRWIATAWPFSTPRFIGRDVSWRDWLDLPSVS